ncbi:MAG: purine-nucleoside phosphorylase [Oscillospiraceae bacterium]|nr:purine-nucleoside phosphorylase [Oscillospiraceae bacterium]
MSHFDFSFYKKSADYVKDVIKDEPETALILGSGLGSFADEIENPVSISYSDIPNFLVSTAPSHEGRLIFGKIGNKKVICMSGRFHHYEGYSFKQLSIPIRLFKLLGVKRVILTNAAGGVNESYSPGDIMIIKDHIKLSSFSPLAGENIPEFGDRFFDVSDMYSSALRKTASEISKSCSLNFHEGVYMYFGGPQFETPAEIRMARLLGADAVGMSTVPEALTAAHCKMPVLGFSVITNMAAGVIPNSKITHEEVGEEAGKISEKFSEYIKKVIMSL